MTYHVPDLIEEIKIALDQNVSSQTLVTEGDIDTLTLDELIRSKIEPAARIVETQAPRHLLDSGRAFGGTIGWRGEVGKGSGVIHLPDDFMRLVTFKMSDWERPVVEAIDETDPRYELQGSRYGGIRGNVQKPVVVITQQPVGQVLEFYSCISGSSVTLSRARYIPYPKIGTDNGIEICEKLKKAVVHYAAYMVAITTGESELAAALQSMVTELMK